MKFGNVDLSRGAFGGYTLVNMPATSLPQELATAVATVNSGLLGATYLPIWYIGHQLVNGTNYYLICQELRAARESNASIVGLVINCPPTDAGQRGEDATVVAIEERAENVPDDASVAFYKATQHLVGAQYRPVAYVGSQVVRGMNHYFICAVRRMVRKSRAYPALVCVNEFNGETMLVSVEPIVDERPGVEAPLGEWP